VVDVLQFAGHAKQWLDVISPGVKEVMTFCCILIILEVLQLLTFGICQQFLLELGNLVFGLMR